MIPRWGHGLSKSSRDVVLAETGYVLESVYRIPRAQVVDGLTALVSRQNIFVLDREKALIIQALLFCRPSRRVSFVDALLWAAARSSRADAVYSFDAALPSDGIEVRH